LPCVLLEDHLIRPEIFVTAINQICGRTKEVLSSMSLLNSSSLLTQLSESKVKSTKSFLCWMSSYSSLYDQVKLDYWNTFVSTPGVKLDSRGFAAEMPKLFSSSFQLVFLQCVLTEVFKYMLWVIADY
jgi:hypothetical protein